MRRLLPALVAALLASVAPAQLTAAERQGLEEAFFLANFTEADLRFDRRPANPPHRVPIFDLTLERPLEGADRLMALHAAGAGTLAAILGDTVREMYGQEAPRPGAVPALDGGIPGAVPEPLRRPLIALLAALQEANVDVRRASAGLTPAERRELIEGLPALAAETSLVAFDFTQAAPDEARMMALLARVDLALLRQAGARLAQRVEAELPTLRTLARTVPIDAPIRFETAGFNVVVAGQGNDLHAARDVHLLIDLGGNDVYTGRYGAGVGYAAVMIDVGGNDVYDVPDASIGAGLLGVGLAYDLGGHDLFRGRSICFGAGIAGVGALYKDGGNDSYHSRALGQGFGLFGIGVLLDTRGADAYHAAYLSQGAARAGGVGRLVDQAGNDTYAAPGLVPLDPRRPDLLIARSQGFGGGYSDRLGGGVGMLTDLSGDDGYTLGAEGQGYGASYGAGSLYDAGGNDSFAATQGAQAVAASSGVGHLYSLGGDNVYAVRSGLAHASAHRFGVALLLDREGDDLYAARDAAPGTAVAHGVAIFLDAAGDDVYLNRPVFVAGAAGIFADLGGADRYGQGFADGHALLAGQHGAALDAGRGGPQAPAPPVTSPRPGSEARPDDAVLADLYARALAPDPAARDRLLAIGLPALEWMLANRLATAGAVGLDLMAEAARLIGQEANARVLAAAGDPRDAVAAGGLALIARLRLAEGGAAAVAALERPALRRAAAEAAGAVRARESVEPLIGMAADEDRQVVLAALEALAQIGDDRAVGTAQVFLRAPELPLRRAAVDVVAGSPARGLAVARTLLDSGEERAIRTGIEILGRIGGDDAIRLVAAHLTSPMAGVRIEALGALDGRVPPEHRPQVLALRNDPNPLVRAVAERVDLGR
jgi:hypothetical protein